MSYREERDALRARVDRLERDLEEARAELSKRAGAPKEGNVFLGGPTSLLVTQSLAGEMAEADFELLVAELQHELGEAGRIDTVGGTRMWSTTGRSGRFVEVTCRAHRGRTRIRLSEPLKNLAGGLFGGAVGGGGGGGMGLVVPAMVALGLGGLAVAVAAAAWVGLVFMVVRAIFGRIAQRRREQLERVMTRFAAELERAEATGLRIDADADAEAEAEREAELEHEAEAEATPPRRG